MSLNLKIEKIRKDSRIWGKGRTKERKCSVKHKNTKNGTEDLKEKVKIENVKSEIITKTLKRG